jgi:diacylglycerol O-acyltransferase/trehalose O-mycolyltransferase
MIRRLFVAVLLVASIVLAGSPGASAQPIEQESRPGNGARVVAEERVGPRLVDLSISSPALAQTVKVRLLTPDGWERRVRHDRWPVLYLLHGMGDDHTTWTEDSDVEQLRQLRDVLVVMPDAQLGWYTDWWNDGAGGPPRWETFHLRELRPLLERHYGAGTRRVVAGLSMGGYGALAYAGRNPGMFRAVASYSGLNHLLHPLVADTFPELDPEALRVWGHPVADRANWEAHDPYHLAGRLRRTPIYLSSGDGTPGPLDPPGTAPDELEAMISELNRSLAGRLRELGAPVRTDFTSGTHNPPYWERGFHRSLPMLLRALRTG